MCAQASQANFTADSTMYSLKLALLVVSTSIGGALAQINTATPSGTGYLVDSCIYDCISQAASSAGCSSLYV